MLSPYTILNRVRFNRVTLKLQSTGTVERCCAVGLLNRTGTADISAAESFLNAGIFALPQWSSSINLSLILQHGGGVSSCIYCTFFLVCIFPEIGVIHGLVFVFT